MIGYGVVGGAVVEGFRRNGHTAAIYDRYKEPYTDFKAILDCDVVFVAVPTPPGDTGYDLTNLKDTVRALSREKYKGIACIISTINPQDYYELIEASLDVQPFDKDGYVLAVSPEFLLEKTANDDFYFGQRVFYGPAGMIEKYDTKLRQALRECRAPGEAVITSMSPEKCYLIKTHNNIASAMKLATANLIFLEAIECGLSEEEAQGIVDTVFEAPHLATTMRYHKVGNYEGTMGFGGMCLPKDLKAKAQKNAGTALGDALSAIFKFNEYLRTQKVGQER